MAENKRNFGRRQNIGSRMKIAVFGAKKHKKTHTDGRCKMAI